MTRCLEVELFPWLGALPIKDIKAAELLAVIRRIEARGAKDTARRMMQSTGQVFRYAVACGLAERDISADLRGVLQPFSRASPRLTVGKTPREIKLSLPLKV